MQSVSDLKNEKNIEFKCGESILRRHGQQKKGVQTFQKPLAFKIEGKMRNYLCLSAFEFILICTQISHIHGAEEK